MEWIEKLNKTISYIEEHLAEEISYDELLEMRSERMEGKLGSSGK